VVEVGPEGWKVIENAECPIIFKRADGAKPLPLPERRGNINDLRPLVNCADDDDFMLLVGTLVSALSPHRPYPLVGAKGEAGSAKSTTQRSWRSLVDPNTVPIPGPPSTPRDFAIAAADGWVFGLNNVSSIPGWMSDDLCRLSTGGGDRRRKLFTDAKQIAFSGMRPIMINSITDVIDRSDLADRTVTVNLPRIKEADRKDEVELDREFERLQPSILGCLLDGVAMALKRQEEVRVRLAGRLPRMASFIVWCEAAGPAFGWSEGEFLRVYKVALNLQNARLLETPLAQAIQALNLPWRGTATELWDKCKATGTGKIPADPARLRRELERLATPLRDALGISVDFERKDRARYIVITKAPLAEFTPQSRRFTVSTVRPSEPTEMDNAVGYHSNPAQGSSAGSASHTER